MKTSTQVAFVLALAIFLLPTISVAFAQNQTTNQTSTNQTNVSNVTAPAPPPGPVTLTARQLAALAATAGVTPDSALYFFDSAFDKVNLWVASLRGPESFTSAAIAVMNETRAETVLMALRNNTAALSTAQSRFEGVKNETLLAVEQLKNDTTRAAILGQITAMTQEKVSWLNSTLINVSAAARSGVLEAILITNASFVEAGNRLVPFLRQATNQTLDALNVTLSGTHLGQFFHCLRDNACVNPNASFFCVSIGNKPGCTIPIPGVCIPDPDCK